MSETISNLTRDSETALPFTPLDDTPAVAGTPSQTDETQTETPRTRRGYTEADTERLLALVDGGKSVAEAASLLGMPPTSAYRRYHKARGPVKPDRVYARRAFPVAEWPEDLRRRADPLTAPERHAVGRLITFQREHDPNQVEGDMFNPDTLDAFAAWRSRQVKPSSIRADFAHIYGAALNLLPDRDWLWLKREVARKRREAMPEKAPDAAPAKKGGRARTLSVTLDEWSAAHRAAFEAAFSPGTVGRFAEFPENPGPLCHKSPEFRRGLERSYSQFLKCVRNHGFSDDVTPEAVQQWIDDCRARNCTLRTIAAYVARLEWVVRIVNPTGSQEWLVLTRDDLDCRARLTRKKKDGRHVDPVNLWLIGTALIREARKGRREREENAKRFRNGLIYMFLSSAPVRLANLAAITIGEHLDLPADRPGSVSFKAPETKGKRPAGYSLWPELRKVLDEYIAVYRPVLAGDYEGEELWLQEHGGGPLKSAGIYNAVVRTSKMFEHVLGGPVNPHFFRDAVATALIEQYPDKPEYAMTMLHHRHPETTREYQEAAESIHAAQRLSDILDTTRNQAKQAA